MSTKNKKRTCDKCGGYLVKVRDFIKQSGYSYYLECPICNPTKKNKGSNNG